MYSCFVSLLALSLPVLTSLNVPAGSAGSGEATEEEEEVAEEGGGNPEGACLPCIARVTCILFAISRSVSCFPDCPCQLVLWYFIPDNSCSHSLDV